MANEIRLRQVGIGGLVEDSAMTATSTLLTSAGLAGITNGVDSSHYMPIILGPDGDLYPPETAYITSLAAGAGATGSTGLLRAQEGSTGQAWPQGTPWVHAVTPEDVVNPLFERLNVIAASGAAQTLSLQTATIHDLTLTANCTLTFAGVAAGGASDVLAWTMRLVLRQDGTGSRTVTWPASVKWPAATAPTISSGVNKVDLYEFVTVNGGTTWLGRTLAQDIR